MSFCCEVPEESGPGVADTPMCPEPAVAIPLPPSGAHRRTEYSGGVRERIARSIDRSLPPGFLNLLQRSRLTWRVTSKEITS